MKVNFRRRWRPDRTHTCVYPCGGFFSLLAYYIVSYYTISLTNRVLIFIIWAFCLPMVNTGYWTQVVRFAIPFPHIQKSFEFNSIACSIYSLVKLHCFQFSFLENCMCNKQKKSIKDQRNFSFDAFFKVFANSIGVHSKIWCSRFSNKKNDMFLFIPPVGDLPENEECLHLTTTMECNSFLI